MKKIVVSLLLVGNLGVIIYFWSISSLPLFNQGIYNIFLALGRILGLLAVYLILLQFTLRGRTPWIEETFGLNTLSKLHHWNGFFLLLFIILHPLFLTIAYAEGKTGLIKQFMDFLINYDDVLKALLAVLAFIGIAFFSIYIVRRKLKYEFWYYVHLFTYVAILFAWGHQLKLGGDFIQNKIFVYYWYFLYSLVLGVFFLFRFGRQGVLFSKYNFKVAKVISEKGEATSVYITGNNLARFKTTAGQFVILRFLDKKRLWEAHPFSLSFIPKNNTLRITAKDVGDFTSQLSTLKQGTPVLVDGPMGTFTTKQASKDKYLFIAGGAGITPIRSMIEEVVEKKKDIILLYSNKTKGLTMLKDELDELAKQHYFQVHYIFTQEKNYAGLQGRIDREKINKLVHDVKTRDVFICGPVLMTNAIIQELLALRVPSSQIHYEKFAL